MIHRDRVSRCFLSATLIMFLLALAANVTPVAYLDGMFHQSDVVVSELEGEGTLLAGTPHGPIAIDGDANFSDTALLEGWPGDGSPENPYIIDGLDIDLGGKNWSCIIISNTRVSFTISNCNLTGASSYCVHCLGPVMGAGIYLENVTNGELVKNMLDGNPFGIVVVNSNYSIVADNTCLSTDNYGILLRVSHSNTVANNIYNSNSHGIYLLGSDSNTLVNNTCNSNTECGILLWTSHSNTVADNTCSNNRIGIDFFDVNNFNTVANNTCLSNTEDGIRLDSSSFNTLANNTCNNNRIGISLFDGSDYNTLANNTCNTNSYGIYLDGEWTYFNTVENNTCNSNTECGICFNESRNNTVVNNTCNDNRIGIDLRSSDSNTVENNTCLNNTEHDIIGESENEEFDPVPLPAFVGFVGFIAILLLGAGWRMAKLSRAVSNGE